MLNFFLPLKIRNYFIDIRDTVFFSFSFCILLYFYLFNWTWLDIFGLPVYVFMKNLLLNTSFYNFYPDYNFSWIFSTNNLFDFIFELEKIEDDEEEDYNDYTDDYLNYLDWVKTIAFSTQFVVDWTNIINITETSLLTKTWQDNLWILKHFDSNQYPTIFVNFNNFFNFTIYFIYCFIKWKTHEVLSWISYWVLEVKFFSNAFILGSLIQFSCDLSVFDQFIVYDLIFPCVRTNFYSYIVFPLNTGIFISYFLTKKFFYLILFSIFFLKTYWVWNGFLIPIVNWLIIKLMYTPNSSIMTINSNYKHFAIFRFIVKLRKKTLIYSNLIVPITFLLAFLIHNDCSKELIIFLIYLTLFCLFFIIKNFILTLLYFFRYYFLFLTSRFSKFTIMYWSLQLINFFITLSIIYIIWNLVQFFILKNINFTFISTLKFFYLFLFITLLIQLFSGFCLFLHKFYFSHRIDIFPDYFYFFKTLKNYWAIKNFLDVWKRAHKNNNFIDQISYGPLQYYLRSRRGDYLYLWNVLYEDYLHFYYRQAFKTFFSITGLLNISPNVMSSKIWNYNILMNYMVNSANKTYRMLSYNWQVASSLFIPSNYFQKVNIKSFNINTNNPTHYKIPFYKKINYIHHNSISWHNKLVNQNIVFNVKFFNNKINRIQIKTLATPLFNNFFENSSKQIFKYLDNIPSTYKRIKFHIIRRLRHEPYRNYYYYKSFRHDINFPFLFFKYVVPTVFVEKWSFWYQYFNTKETFNFNSKKFFKTKLIKKLDFPLLCQTINQFNIYIKIVLNWKIFSPIAKERFSKNFKIKLHREIRRNWVEIISLTRNLKKNWFKELYISTDQKYKKLFDSNKNLYSNLYRKTLLNAYKNAPSQFQTASKFFLHTASFNIKSIYEIKKLKIDRKNWKRKNIFRIFINPQNETYNEWFHEIDRDFHHQAYHRQYWLPYTKLFSQPYNTNQANLKTLLNNSFNSNWNTQTLFEKNNMFLNYVFQPKNTYFISLTLNKNFDFAKYFYNYTFFNKTMVEFSKYQWTKNWLYLKSFKFTGSYGSLQVLLNIIPGLYKISIHDTLKTFLYSNSVTTFFQQSNKPFFYKIYNFFNLPTTKQIKENLIKFRLQYFQLIEALNDTALVQFKQKHITKKNNNTYYDSALIKEINKFEMLYTLSRATETLSRRMLMIYWQLSYVYDPQTDFVGPWTQMASTETTIQNTIIKDFKYLKKNKKLTKLINIIIISPGK